MKVYVSLPISKYNLGERKMYAYIVKGKLLANHEIDEVVTPFDVCSEPDKLYGYYMGKGIEALFTCDAICLCPLWIESKGCVTELLVAANNDKRVMEFDEYDNEKALEEIFKPNTKKFCMSALASLPEW